MARYGQNSTSASASASTCSFWYARHSLGLDTSDTAPRSPSHDGSLRLRRASIFFRSAAALAASSSASSSSEATGASSSSSSSNRLSASSSFSQSRIASADRPPPNVRPALDAVLPAAKYLIPG